MIKPDEIKPGEKPRRRTTTQLVREVLAAQDSDQITLDTLLVPLRARAFGVLLLVLAIPNFIPAPIGIGGIMGTLVAILGLQMLFGLEHPLIPKRMRRRAMRRQRLEQFLDRCIPVTRRLEKWCKPRLINVMTRPWSLVSGLTLLLLGILLALPIPFTNYLFGVILLAYAFALIERDGALVIALWVLTLVLAVLSVVFSHVLIEAMQQVWQYFT